jgi:hypothetical protein
LHPQDEKIKTIFARLKRRGVHGEILLVLFFKPFGYPYQLAKGACQFGNHQTGFWDNQSSCIIR